MTNPTPPTPVSPTARPDLPASGILRIDAAGLAEATRSIAPASLLLEREAGTLRILAADRPAEIDRHPAAPAATRIDRPGHVLLPALANAHTHLDLTHIGPLPHDPAAGFVAWVERLRAARRTDPDGIAASVAQGAALARRSGVMAVGDIAGAVNARTCASAARALAGTRLAGVSFLEVFAIGVHTEASLDALEAELYRDGPNVGISPHAPYTVSIPAYLRLVELAADRGLRMHTHLAETPEERAFVTQATGPNRDMLERLGIWRDDDLAWLARTDDPVLHLEPVLRAAAERGVPFVAAHVNDCSGAALDLLASTGVTVAYCPRASAYFDAPSRFGPHRYRDMLAAGIPVALGTDSIINLPTDTPARGMSTLDEARLLFARDSACADTTNTFATTLIAMATTHAAAAIGLDPAGFTLSPSSSPRAVLAVPVGDHQPGDAAAAALSATTTPEVILQQESVEPTNA